MTIRKWIKATSLVAIVSVSATTYAHGDESKEKRFPESQYRHDVMEHAKYGMQNIVQHMKGEANHEGHVAKLAEIIALAASMTKESFAKDTRGMEGKTGAKDSIWENWDDFAARADTFAADAAAYAEAVKTGDMESAMPAFKKMASNCKSCHDKYED